MAPSLMSHINTHNPRDARRGHRRCLHMALTCLLISEPMMSAPAPPPGSTAKVETGPTMDDIAKWIRKELPALGTDHIIKKKEGARTLGNNYTIDKSTLADCTLSIQQTDRLDDVTYGWATTTTIPLKDVDLSAISSRELGTWPGYTQNKPSYGVRLSALPGVPPFNEIKEWANTKKEQKTVTFVWVRLREEASTHQLETYLRRAAMLCGAPDPTTAAAKSPIATAPNAQAPSSDKPPASAPPVSKPSSTSAPGTLTNADVIAMLNAGLSELVIANSIRQAADRSFDLSPTGLVALKKAKLPDSLIVVMQSAPAAGAVPPAPTATAPRKYDATMTRKYQADKAAAAVAATGCTGIEMMGLFKNEIFDRAMGGGITEWLVKIRNNTAVTRIVVFGWRDQYGQEQTSQVQVRGGDIASPRLDMTQARYIAPTTDVKLVSCQ